MSFIHFIVLFFGILHAAVIHIPSEKCEFESCLSPSLFLCIDVLENIMSYAQESDARSFANTSYACKEAQNLFLKNNPLSDPLLYAYKVLFFNFENDRVFFDDTQKKIYHKLTLYKQRIERTFLNYYLPHNVPIIYYLKSSSLNYDDIDFQISPTYFAPHIFVIDQENLDASLTTPKSIKNDLLSKTHESCLPYLTPCKSEHIIDYCRRHQYFWFDPDFYLLTFNVALRLYISYAIHPCFSLPSCPNVQTICPLNIFTDINASSCTLVPNVYAFFLLSLVKRVTVSNAIRLNFEPALMEYIATITGYFIISLILIENINNIDNGYVLNNTCVSQFCIEDAKEKTKRWTESYSKKYINDVNSQCFFKQLELFMIPYTQTEIKCTLQLSSILPAFLLIPDALFMGVFFEYVIRYICIKFFDYPYFP